MRTTCSVLSTVATATPTRIGPFGPFTGTTVTRQRVFAMLDTAGTVDWHSHSAGARSASASFSPSAFSILSRDSFEIFRGSFLILSASDTIFFTTSSWGIRPANSRMARAALMRGSPIRSIIRGLLDSAGGRRLLQSLVMKKLPKRKPDSHKGDYGRVLVVAGSRGMAGAATLCAEAAYRSGAGLVYIACPESIVDVMSTKTTCAVVWPYGERQVADQLLEFSRKCDVAVIGPGLS